MGSGAAGDRRDTSREALVCSWHVLGQRVFKARFLPRQPQELLEQEMNFWAPAESPPLLGVGPARVGAAEDFGRLDVGLATCGQRREGL